MFDIKLEFDDIRIVSVEKEDVEEIYRWFKDESMDQEVINYHEFYERFLEYYFSECEFFLRVEKEKKLLGIFKGRIEFKNPNDVWIKYFLLDKSIRNSNMGSKILKLILKYFLEDCGIYNFYVRIQKEDYKYLKFWQKNKFYISEVLRESDPEITILKKRIVKT